MLRISITVLFIFICGLFSSSYAQDTTKTNPAQVQKNVSKYKSYRTRTAKTDSGALKAGAQQTAPSTADTSAPAPAEDKSLKGQYQFLLTKVYHYQQPFVFPFWKNISDTLKLYHQVQKAANSKLILQNKIIDSLKTQIAGKDEALSSRVEEINLFGLQMSLTVYNLIVWGLMIGFALIAIIVISSSSSYRSEAKYRSNLYSDLEDEFKTFKTKANEREKKLARELQTERNKLDELMGGDENDAV